MKNDQKDLKNLAEDVFLLDIKKIAHEARRQAYQAADLLLVIRNWLIGWRIVEQEQQGEHRAEYGKRVIELASQSLTLEFGKGFGETSIRNMRRFYLKFKGLQIQQNHSAEFESIKLPSQQILQSESVIPFYPNLSWSHYERLMRVDDEKARLWYLHETAKEQWDYKTLQRNISTQYYYRLLQTPDMLKPQIIGEMRTLTASYENDKFSFMKNPIVAEFLGLSKDSVLSESNLETAIIDHLQSFIMELGKGYAFVARQQHIRTDMGDFYIDLVFYNIILKCYLIIDCKSSQITHQDVGQMDMYIRMYDELKKEEDNNPTIGLLLCADTSKDLARYSILKDSKQLYAAKYLTYLPSEAELIREIKAQKKIFELQSGKFK